MADRFDLEQKLIKMFEIVEDIKLVNEYVGDPRLEALATLWAIKVEDMWNTFEEYVHDEARKRDKDDNVE